MDLLSRAMTSVCLVTASSSSSSAPESEMTSSTRCTEGRSQMMTELRALAAESSSDIPLESLQNLSNILWSDESRLVFSSSFNERVITFLCCANRLNFNIPPEIVGAIFSHFSLSDDLLTNIVSVNSPSCRDIKYGPSRCTRIYSLHTNIALDVRSERDCDGEIRIQVRERQYNNNINMHKMSCNMHDYPDMFYWKRLRDGSDYSWKSSKLSAEKLIRLQQVVLGDQSVVDVDSFFAFILQF